VIALLELLGLHKSFLCRFRVDAAVFQAQAFNAERKDCTAAAPSKAPNARSRGRMRRLRIAIDPVETGFPGAGMSREM
jgi:hypothetical protein